MNERDGMLYLCVGVLEGEVCLWGLSRPFLTLLEGDAGQEV